MRKNHLKTAPLVVQKNFKKSEKKACQRFQSSINEEAGGQTGSISRSKKLSKK
jgi:hypothetical protein